MTEATEISEIDVSDPDCLFCRIVSGQIPADIVAEGEQVLAFRDIDPVAPTHVLVIPREHHSTIGELAQSAPDALVELVRMAAADRRPGVRRAVPLRREHGRVGPAERPARPRPRHRWSRPGLATRLNRSVGAPRARSGRLPW